MSFKEFFNKMKSIQNDLLEFLEDESDAEDKYENFVKLLSTQQIINDKYKFKGLLYNINSISNDHQRVGNFISKIERLLASFKKDIQKYFTNSEIFKIFWRNKRILLFLIEENMITIDEYCFSKISRDHGYCQYFQPEIKPFLTKENIKKYFKTSEDDEFIENLKKEVDDDFFTKRKEGENDHYLCKLIRFNQIVEFITFVEQTNLPLDIVINYSIFETNRFLNDNQQTSLIEYASFYGSIDIIKWLMINGVKLTQNTWKYAIHSRNAEVINYLEENHISPPKNDYEPILEESIKCHHIEFSNYIIDSLINKKKLINNINNEFYHNVYRYALEYYNYCYFPKNIEYKYMFFYLCELDYYTLVKLYLEERNIDINTTI